MSSIRIGQRGEEIAARFLLSEGFDLLHRNWRSGRYELDIVARKEGVLHIVEVKSRKADGLTAPEEAMTRKNSTRCSGPHSNTSPCTGSTRIRSST